MLKARTKPGQIAITEVTFTKAELATIPSEERTHYFALAHTANEISMLRVLAIQAMNNAGARPIKEAGLGLAFMFARTLAVKVAEGWKRASKVGLNAQFLAMAQEVGPEFCSEVCPDVASARADLESYFADTTNVLTRVRNKLAAHTDSRGIDEAFDMLPDAMELIDFHTGVRGSTFYGAADTVIAIATSAVIGSNDPREGLERLIKDGTRLSGDLETVIDGYLVAVAAKHFGFDRFQAKPAVINLSPSARAGRVHYFTDLRRQADKP